MSESTQPEPSSRGGLEVSDDSGRPCPSPHGPACDRFPASVPEAPRRPPPLEAGLFGTLFDLSRDNIEPLRLARLLYTYAAVCISVVSLVSFLYGWSLMVGTPFSFWGWCLVAGVPVLWLGVMILARLAAEYVILQTRTSQNVMEVRDTVHEMRDHARSS
jgi:hypothetical protein